MRYRVCIAAIAMCCWVGVPVWATLNVEKSVYVGHDSGASCPGVQFLQDTNGTLITYCVQVANEGPLTLTNVVLSDLALGIVPVQIGTLTNGEVATYHFEEELTWDLVNVAMVTGQNPTGGVEEASDTAEVDAVIAFPDCTNTYEVIEIPTLGGDASIALDLNDFGQVVGKAKITNGQFYAFLWDANAITNLGTLPDGSNSYAAGINNRGQIAGGADATGLHFGAEILNHAFRYESNVMTDLGTLGGKNSDGWAINEAGDVAGWSFRIFQNFNINPFLHTKGTNINLQVFDGVDDSGQAMDVNNSTQVVGFAFALSTPSGGNGFVPFIWQDLNTNNADDDGEMKHLGTFGGAHGIARGISDIMQITGGADTTNAGERDAFLLTPMQTATGPVWYVDGNTDTINDLMLNLGTLPGDTIAEGFDVNLSGTVVGRSTTDTNLSSTAFVYRQGVMEDLNDLIDTNTGWFLNEAYAVDNLGRIVGFGTLSNDTRGFLLQPCSEQGTNLEISRLIIADHDPNQITLVWRGAAVNQPYTVETTPSLIQPAWTSVPPTSQWPINVTFWHHTVSSNSPQQSYRIRVTTNL